VQENLESSMAIEINNIKCTRTGIKNDAATGEDFS
jgi:hypothetical protein